ncbi:sensor histidine kinase [Pseudomonas typographi]|uniref:histidine kinase n=1 Tax=Pseudomonas typographi TaxID=2715964 RepID=A0ABR7YXQ2_9PSED|nr:ATP-binding protein [Pseudomonas typographi]MBD1551055.1 PAS domain-containing sensor histidine kinase [Pseudomonas typographi]MBD1587968.1 PAS domain-containing sensor histidine kinase [Pseudomonas typographi]MBD1597957.1 PAS domain-containing sensor histidine kinase [Pseudomonas typographi]
MLRLYNLYRLIIGLSLVLLISSDFDSRLMELANIALFRAGSWAYLGLNVAVVLLLGNVRHPARAFTLAAADVILLAGLFYAGGGIPSGIGNLMIASVAMGNLLLRSRLGLLLAAMASIGIIYITFYLNYARGVAPNDYLQAGSLGVLCFAVALIVQGLIRLLRTSEDLAERRASDVTSLEALNALILQRMRTGIIVLDAEHRVQLANQGALALLGQPSLVGESMVARAPELIERLLQWRRNPTLRVKSLRLSDSGPALQPNFVALNRGEREQTLVFLEDLSAVAQQAQQLKLAALGRLTASIAHEIRNPLGAISHAGQLLQESDALPAPDQRLVQIILDHSKRMNLIVENVLQLSRRRAAKPEILDLKHWLRNFARDFRPTDSANQQLNLQLADGPIETRIDPSQLAQVLTNLVENGLRYSGQRHAQAQVWLNLYVDPHSGLPVLDVLDDGAGFPSDKLQHIFEPFFTTETNGTGLGLYISRELCENNQAHLDYRPREHGGSCMRITFAHAKKQG